MKDTTPQAAQSCHELLSVRRFTLGIGIIMRCGVGMLAEGYAPIYLPRTTTIQE